MHFIRRKLSDTAPGVSGLPARVWKALGATPEAFALVRQIVHGFWLSEEMPPEWEACLLSILPKKGDLRLPGNYRGIMMLEVGYKIVSIVLNARLQPVAESLDDESQSVRCAALRVLARMSPLALSEGGGPAVIGRCLEDDSTDVRLASMQVLTAWGGDVLTQYRDTIEGLEAADPRPEVRLAASLLLRSPTD